MSASPGDKKAVFQPWNDPNETPFIEIRNVTKRFGEFTAVDDVSLNIYKREFYSLLGPSGCGKTTLLRMLAGFERPTEGTILLDGEDMSQVPPHERPVNMMFQSYALFPHMTVEQNIGFGLKQERVPRDEIRKRVAEVIEMVQLGPFARRKPHQLSGGQRQRVALARSIVKQPKMLLLDEPLGALDKKLRQSTQFELMNIQEELGLTFIIVTHDQDEAMTVSSRIAVMEAGKVIQVAPPAEIYEYPNSRYVAEFLGDINIFEGRLEKASEAGGSLVNAPEAGATIRGSVPVDAPPGATVWVAVRPEKFTIARDEPADPALNVIEGTVWDIGYIGNLSIYHVRLDSGKTVTCAQTNFARLVEREIKWDDRVFLSWRPDAGIVLLS
jgi:putrescine transport system ATP-binding protein